MLVGVIPNSADFAHPADRRRYVPYFKKKEIAFETAQFEKHYDAVYISIAADLGRWAGYRGSQRARGNDVRVIFDLSDGHLMASPLTDALRSVYHYLAKRTASFSLSYRRTLINMMRASDVVLCGSEEQKAILSRYHPYVVVVRDDYGGDVRVVKSSYRLASEDTLNVFWEGFSHGNIGMFKLLRRILDGVSEFRVNLHLATDSEYCGIGATHFCRPTFRVLQRVFARSRVRFHLYDWNAVTFSAVAACCDLALIPIPDDPVTQMKPENKLLLLWSVGLPVIASSTPSYARVMRSIGEEFVCSRFEEWREKIVGLGSSVAARERYMSSARKYLQQNLSGEALAGTWDTIFFGAIPGGTDVTAI